MYTLHDQLLYTQLECVVEASRVHNQEMPAYVLSAFPGSVTGTILLLQISADNVVKAGQA